MGGDKHPYTRLFIYHLDGHPGPNPWERNPAFLGCWVEDGYAFLFFSQPSLDVVLSALNAQNGPRLLDQYEMSYEEWQGGEEIQPIRSGRVVIVPFWQQVEPGENDIVIRIDPGVVFGAGAHPTTRDCLSALNHLFSCHKPRKVLDIGTGTGILALAAAALGAEKVVAVDLNPLCIRTTTDNVVRNNFQSVIDAVEGDALEFVHREADLLIANIHMAVVGRLIDSPGFPGKRWVILSGLLRSQAHEIECILHKKKVRIIRDWRSSGTWTTFLLENV